MFRSKSYTELGIVSRTYTPIKFYLLIIELTHSFLRHKLRAKKLSQIH